MDVPSAVVVSVKTARVLAPEETEEEEEEGEGESTEAAETAPAE